MLIAFVILFSSTISFAQTILPFDPLKILPSTHQKKEEVQNTKRIQIIYADSLVQETDTVSNIITRSLEGAVRLLHEGAYMNCRVATLFPQSNYLEAHGNIKITKGDSIKIYSQDLKYDGNTKMAYLEKEVKIDNKGSILTAPLVSYDIENEIGYFYESGKIVTDSTVLTSNTGVNFQKEEYAILKGNVILKNPDYVMYADSMIYYTDTKIARFITRTIIISDHDTIITDKGYFDTKNNKAVLESRSSVKRGNEFKLTSDKIDYDKSKKSGIAQGNAISASTKDKAYILANYLKYNDSTKYNFATHDPLMIKRDEKDTLFLSADTLINFTIPSSTYLKKYSSNHLDEKLDTLPILDTIEKVDVDFKKLIKEDKDSLSVSSDTLKAIQILQKDTLSNQSKDKSVNITNINVDTDIITDTLNQKRSLVIDAVYTPKNEPDSVKVFYGYKNVKLIRSNMSGICDSIYFDSHDSIYKLFKDPILWMDSTQLKSDSIYIFMKNGNAERIELYQNAIIISQEDPAVFNQISGRKITGWLDSNRLKEVLVDGNAESIYFLKNDSSEYIGGNQSESALIRIYMDDSNKIERLRLEGTPKATFTPIRQINFSTFRLDHFDWYHSYKPKTKWYVIRDKKQYEKFLTEYPVDTNKTEKDTLKKTMTILQDSLPSIEKISLENTPDIITIDDRQTQSGKESEKTSTSPTLEENKKSKRFKSRTTLTK